MPKHDRAVHVVEGGSLRATNEPVGFRRRGPVRESGAQKNAAGRLLRRGGLRAAERVVRKRDRGSLEGFVLLRGFSLFPKHRGFEPRAAGRVGEGFGRQAQRLFDGFRGVRGVRIRYEGKPVVECFKGGGVGFPPQVHEVEPEARREGAFGGFGQGFPLKRTVGENRGADVSHPVRFRGGGLALFGRRHVVGEPQNAEARADVCGVGALREIAGDVLRRGGGKVGRRGATGKKGRAERRRQKKVRAHHFFS